MSLFVASINSGSNGNCYYVGNENEAVLIDAGISCRETVKRMKRIGLSMDKVKAIFISHEHNDHIRGVEVLAGKYQLPVYITDATFKNSFVRPNRKLAVHFTADEPIAVGGLTVYPFTKLHDAIDPHSFMISNGKINIGVFTDIGEPCEDLVYHFKQCHAAFLETNYDEEMLMNGRYPIYLKRRISGREGHLSNTQALELFMKHKPKFMSHIFLSHISKENNRPDIAAELFSRYAGHTNVLIASRYEESGVYEIESAYTAEPRSVKVKVMAEQMSLF